MYICVCICTYVYMYMYVCIHVYIHTCMHTYTQYVYVCIYIYIYMNASIYVCVCVCLQVCVCVCVCDCGCCGWWLVRSCLLLPLLSPLLAAACLAVWGPLVLLRWRSLGVRLLVCGWTSPLTVAACDARCATTSVCVCVCVCVCESLLLLLLAFCLPLACPACVSARLRACVCVCVCALSALACCLGVLCLGSAVATSWGTLSGRATIEQCVVSTGSFLAICRFPIFQLVPLALIDASSVPSAGLSKKCVCVCVCVCECVCVCVCVCVCARWRKTAYARLCDILSSRCVAVSCTCDATRLRGPVFTTSVYVCVCVCAHSRF